MQWQTGKIEQRKATLNEAFSSSLMKPNAFYFSASASSRNVSVNGATEFTIRRGNTFQQVHLHATLVRMERRISHPSSPLSGLCVSTTDVKSAALFTNLSREHAQEIQIRASLLLRKRFHRYFTVLVV